MGTKQTYHTNLDQLRTRARNLVLCIEENIFDPEQGDLFQTSVGNTLRFHNCLLRDATDQRVIFIPPNSSFPRSPFSNTLLHHLQRRDEAFATLVLNYRPGDKIFLVGGGSGAAVALLVAQLLDKVGIPETITFVCGDDGRIVRLEHPACTEKGQVRSAR